MYKYRCFYSFKAEHENTNMRHQVTVRFEGLYNFCGGFWIDKDLKFTKGSECKYWIPPSQILYIEKITL